MYLFVLDTSSLFMTAAHSSSWTLNHDAADLNTQELHAGLILPTAKDIWAYRKWEQNGFNWFNL